MRDIAVDEDGDARKIPIAVSERRKKEHRRQRGRLSLCGEDIVPTPWEFRLGLDVYSIGIRVVSYPICCREIELPF